MLYTEEAVRAGLRVRDGRRVFYLPEGSRLTPAARDWLRQEGVTVVPHAETPPTAYRTPDGASFAEKPEHMTHLRGNILGLWPNALTDIVRQLTFLYISHTLRCWRFLPFQGFPKNAQKLFGGNKHTPFAGFFAFVSFYHPGGRPRAPHLLRRKTKPGAGENAHLFRT